MKNRDLKLEDKKNKILSKIKIYSKKEVIKKEVKDYAILILSSFILTFSYDFFISATTSNGIFPSGMGGIAHILAIYTNTNDPNKQNIFYFIYYFSMNLPLFIFSIFKNNVKFSLKTILFIFLQIIFNFIIMLTPINPNDFHILVDYAKLLNTPGGSINYQLWLFVFAVLAGITYGYACGLAYSVSCSTGGTDFISMYFSIKKKKSIGNINKMINLFILVIVLIMKDFHTTLSEFKTIFKEEHSDHTIAYYRWKYLFGAPLFASLLLIFIQTAVINITYPKYQYRTLFIITKKSDIVIKTMRKAGTVLNDISVWDAINTQLDENQDTKGYKIIMSTITLVEYRRVKKSIIKGDPYARVFLQRVDRIAGSYKIREL